MGRLSRGSLSWPEGGPAHRENGSGGPPGRPEAGGPTHRGPRHLPPPPLPPAEEALLAAYGQALRLAGLRSGGRYLATAREFLAYLADHGLSYERLPAGLEADYRGSLLAAAPGLARATVNNKCNRLRRFYRYLKRQGRVAANPFEGLRRLPPAKRLPRAVLSGEQMRALLDGFALLTERDWMLRSMAELLYGSALRVSDVAALRRGDIDGGRALIEVSDVKAGGRRRLVPATQASLQALQEYLRHGYERLTSAAERQAGYLYPQRGESSLRGLLNRALARECGRRGLPRLTTHSFRHAAATHLLRGGAGIRQVQALLGHRRIGTTAIYTQVVKEDLRQVVHRFHPREQAPEAAEEEKGEGR